MQFGADADISYQKDKIKILIPYNVNQDIYNWLIT